jgi:hypothetical protein
MSREAGVSFRDHWYCSPQCLVRNLQKEVARLRRIPMARSLPDHRMPLGLTLVSRGQLTAEQLRGALAAQRAAGCDRIGQWLIRLGFTDERQVLTALGLQWGCPVFNLNDGKVPDCAGLIPLKLLEHYRILPVQYVSKTRTLYLGFSDAVDHSLMYSLEHMLMCKTKWCAVSGSSVNKLLVIAAEERRLTEVAFNSECPDDEVARISVAYMLKLGSQTVRVMRCGTLLWIRLSGGDQETDLLFRS